MKYINRIFEPQGNNIFTGAGQSIVSIAEMVLSLPADKKPILIALYEGFDSTGYKRNPDILEAHNLFPGAFLQIGLQFPVYDNKALRKLGEGFFDKDIEAAAEIYKSIKLPIFLRVGYEFDGVWNSYEPEAYKRAYRRIVDIFRQKEADNVVYVWNAYVNNDYDMFKWYPDNPDTGEADGDSYVDWFCYNTVTARFEADWYMEQAKIHRKPVMIGESSYAIVKEGYTFENWLQDYFSAIEKYGVKGFQYINWDWHCYPQATDWTSWKNGRYTAEEGLTEKYNSYMSAENFMFRDSTYHQPVVLHVHCARALWEADEDHIPWKLSHDHSAVITGASYEVENTVVCYGNGWTPYLESTGDTARVIIKIPEKGMYTLALKLKSNYFNDIPESYFVEVNGIRYKVSAGLGGYCKIPVTADANNKVTVEISGTDEKRLVRIYEMGLLSVNVNAPEAPVEIKAEAAAEGRVISWSPVEGAFLYNIYKNYQLIGMSQETFYTDRECYCEKNDYFISACDEKHGEGHFTRVISA